MKWPKRIWIYKEALFFPDDNTIFILDKEGQEDWELASIIIFPDKSRIIYLKQRIWVF